MLLLREQNLDLIQAEEEKTNAWKEKWAYRDPPPFQANPLPASNRVGLYDELVGSNIREMENRRTLINKVREDRKGLKPNPFDYLPPRMAEHEQQNLLKKSLENTALTRKFRAEFTFKPKLNHFSDDFNWELYYSLTQILQGKTRPVQRRPRSEEGAAQGAGRTDCSQGFRAAPVSSKEKSTFRLRQGVKRVYLDKALRARSAPHSRINWRKEPDIVPAMTKKFDQLVKANKEKRFLKHNESVRNHLVEDERKRRRAEVRLSNVVRQASDLLAGHRGGAEARVRNEAAHGAQQTVPQGAERRGVPDAHGRHQEQGHEPPTSCRARPFLRQRHQHL